MAIHPRTDASTFYALMYLAFHMVLQWSVRWEGAQRQLHSETAPFARGKSWLLVVFRVLLNGAAKHEMGKHQIVLLLEMYMCEEIGIYVRFTCACACLFVVCAHGPRPM